MEVRNDKAAKDRLVELIKDARIAMLTTRHADGSMHSRPMGTIEAEFDGHLWFMTDKNADMAAEIQAISDVALTYSDERKQNYVSISGRAEILHDPAKVRELWSEFLRVWFPKGPTDSAIALLKVTVDCAEYWDAPSSMMLHAYGYVKAVTTGERPHPGDQVAINY
ncbi:pyridoxamine 5'-phosphate oxidase family protein [Geminicoccus flavidas]|uniref:pyridoxamine 5'-phosphate oxidase family protein n=1 Tax=Geminicoccus flavidas TaxID=2506407 RepID=UPI001357D79F|nr:pyridoxamine 5'-phosphate oxidase family protein [Geminicoccus flavidas]